MQRNKEKNVIVSGGGTGVGRAIAPLRFAKEGATLGLLEEEPPRNTAIIPKFNRTKGGIF